MFGRVARNTRGAAAAEYALILATVGSLIAVAALALGTTITSSIGNTSANIASAGHTP